jgi:hypothetical protein
MMIYGGLVLNAHMNANGHCVNMQRGNALPVKIYPHIDPMLHISNTCVNDDVPEWFRCSRY